MQARKFPNCRKLAHELEVSAKTIQRDIEFMRYQLGLPIEYDQLHFGFVYTEPVTSFPNIQVSEGEIVALFVAQKALQQYRGTPFEAPLRAAFRKIGHGLKDRITFSWSDLDAAISFRSAGQSVADLEVFEAAQSRRARTRPRLSFVIENCAAPRRRRGGFGRITSVASITSGISSGSTSIASSCGPLPCRAFANRDGPGRVFGGRRIFPSANFSTPALGFSKANGRTMVRVRFQPFAAQLVRERIWHHSQRIKELRDGGLELQLQLGSLEEIERWILSWGDQAEVLEPAKLRQRLAEVGRKFVAQYGAK